MKFESTKEVSTKRFYGVVVGESGCGKTYLAKTLPGDQKRILIISLEHGLMSLKGTDIPVFKVDDTNTWESMCEIIEWLQRDNGETFDYVYIDSLTEIVEKILNELKRDPKLADSKNTFLLWGKLKDNMKMILASFRNMQQYSVVFTCLSCKEKDGLLLVDGFKMPGGTKDEVKPMVDIVLHYQMFKDDDGSVIRKLVTSNEISPLAKDRSGALDHYEEPDLSIIIKKILGT